MATYKLRFVKEFCDTSFLKNSAFFKIFRQDFWDGNRTLGDFKETYKLRFFKEVQDILWRHINKNFWKTLSEGFKEF